MFSLARVHSSNMPHSEKSGIRRFVEMATGNGKITKGHAVSAGHALRSSGEALVVGGVAGAVDAMYGLDYKKVPMDLVAGAALTAVSVVIGDVDGHHDLRNAGADLLAIGAFRQGGKFAAAKMKEHGKKPVGMFAGDLEDLSSEIHMGAEDPIIAAARHL